MSIDRRDLLTAGGLFLLALCLRLPYLQLVPRFTDEFGEVLWAWRIAEGDFWPLTHNSRHIGVVFPYLLAALLRLTGPSTDLPRLFVAVSGAAVAPVTYALGCTIAHRRTGVLAGLLVATSSALILINSHIAYSSSLTPLFVTAALLATMWTWSARRPWSLPVAGLIWGLALQTHPAAAPWLAGVALAFVGNAGGRRSLRSPWPWLGLLAFLAGYANMIYYNLSADLGTLRSMAAKPGYFGHIAATSTEYVQRLRCLVLTLIAGMVGAPNWTPPPAVSAVLAPALIASLVAYWWVARHSRRGPLALALLVAVLLSPVFNQRFAYPSGTRYLCPALPVVFVLAAEGAAAMGGPPGTPRRCSIWRLLVLGWAVVALAAPLAWLTATYRRAEAHGRTNRSILTLVESAAAPDLPQPVVLDPHLALRKVESGGSLAGVTRYLLTMVQVPYETWDLGSIARAVEVGAWPTMILLRETYEHLAWRCYPRPAEIFGLAPRSVAQFDKFDDRRWSAGLFAPAHVDQSWLEGSTFGDVAKLAGYTWSPAVVRPGERAFLTLFWVPLRKTETPLSAFVHVAAHEGRQVAQADGWPRDSWADSTVSWQPGRTVEDRHSFLVPADVASGVLRVAVGLYDPVNGRRLPAVAKDGRRWPEDAVKLARTLSVVGGQAVSPRAEH